MYNCVGISADFQMQIVTYATRSALGGSRLFAEDTHTTVIALGILCACCQHIDPPLLYSAKETLSFLNQGVMAQAHNTNYN